MKTADQLASSNGAGENLSRHPESTISQRTISIPAVPLVSGSPHPMEIKITAALLLERVVERSRATLDDLAHATGIDIERLVEIASGAGDAPSDGELEAIAAHGGLRLGDVG